MRRTPFYEVHAHIRRTTSRQGYQWRIHFVEALFWLARTPFGWIILGRRL